MKKSIKLITLFLTVVLSINGFVAHPTPVLADEGYRELKIHYVGHEENVTFHIWDEKDVFYEEVDSNWAAGSLALTQDEKSYPYYTLKIKNTVNDWLLNYIVRYNGAQTKDMKLNIGSSVTDLYVDEHENYSFEDPNGDTQEATDFIYVHFLNESVDPDQVTLWAWTGAHPDYREGNWDTDRLKPFDTTDQFITFKVGLVDDADLFQFLVHYGDGQTKDFSYSIQSDNRDIYVRKSDEQVFLNPDFSDVSLRSFRWTDHGQLQIVFPSSHGLEVADVYDRINLFKDNSEIDFNVVAAESDSILVSVEPSDFTIKSQYTLVFDEKKEYEVIADWQYIDDHFATDQKLGLTWNDNNVKVAFWSPSATAVDLVIYDKEDPTLEIGSIPMDEIDNVWNITLSPEMVELTDLTNYYYQFKITRFGETLYALDPYAISMAPWNGLENEEYSSSANPNFVGKAAFVNGSAIEMETGFAEIDGYEGREDAIIYEVHVRDFTSDNDLTTEADFGTYDAFIERLDYIQDLGVTHIQLLPIMSYYNIDELNRAKRTWDPTLQGVDSNYNWGYDPHSYFSLSGVYSKDATQADLRIKELKALIDEIHNRGMGVILDVVYNHTARTHIFEDLQPNYYHFMDYSGNSKTSFGGGRLGTTHKMASRILTDSIMYWVENFNVDGFRFDMMGDHDAESIQKAYDLASSVNPNVLMLGEGWVTFVGDDGDYRQAADQGWMQHTDAVGVFSDQFRNELKSGFGSEGQPMFLTGGHRNIDLIFNNIKAQPTNFYADAPHDVVNYVEAHDNLSLYDVIAQSIRKDPKDHNSEILQRQRLGNFLVMTSQGTAFMQAGQEYGKTRQVIHEDFKSVYPGDPCGNSSDAIIHKGTCMVDENGNPFEYPYFIHDSYNSSDWINHFDWSKVTDDVNHKDNVQTMEYTKGLIALRRSTDAFSLEDRSTVDANVTLLNVNEQQDNDLILAYQTKDEGMNYFVLINADNQDRTFTFDSNIQTLIQNADVLVDQLNAGTTPILNPVGINRDGNIVVSGLTGIVLSISDEDLADFAKVEHPEMDEAAVFHAWNWSFKNIEDNLEDLKNAGFNAIQTSPVQPTKENTMSASSWWLLYQPLDFSIGNAQLGTKAEFESMMDKANELEMPIIVDVVLNHLGNAGGGDLSCVYHPNIREDLKFSEYWRVGCVTDWQSREEITQKGIGLPDLNTSHPYVQQIILEFLNELESMGVSGFRFDAAKHIELPNDSGPKSDFWNVILKGISKDTYVYGEILQDTGDELHKYAGMLDVTASNHGHNLANGLYNKHLPNLSDYNSGLPAKDLVTWIESHDTFANAEGNTDRLTDEDLRLGWAILGSRASNTALFFNRPTNALETQVMGDVGSDLWQHDEIVAINTFRNDMSGQSEYIRQINDQTVIIERGTKGVVIVNIGDTEVNIDSETNLLNGNYRNELDVEEGFFKNLFNRLFKETYTVADGRIKTTIAPRSIIILSVDEDSPVISMTPTIDQFGTETQDITIELENATTGAIRVNGGEWQDFNDSITLTIGEGDLSLTKYVIEVTAQNDLASSNHTFTVTKVLPLSESIIVYFKKPSHWGDNINLYYYHNEEGPEVNNVWPGESMSLVDGWYSFTLPDTVDFANIIINDGTNQYPGSFQPGIPISNTIWINENLEVTDNNPLLDYDALDATLTTVREQYPLLATKAKDAVKDSYDQVLRGYSNFINQEEVDEADQTLSSLINNSLRQEKLDTVLQMIKDLEDKGLSIEEVNRLTEAANALIETEAADEMILALQALLDTIDEEAPGEENPDEEDPEEENPDEEDPEEETPDEENPDEEDPEEENPDEEDPEEETPGEQSPNQEKPDGETQGEQNPEDGSKLPSTGYESSTFVWFSIIFIGIILVLKDIKKERQK